MNNSNIEYKLLEETDLELMLDFVDDESTVKQGIVDRWKRTIKL